MKIGFIGLGHAGGKLAGSLLRNGFDLTVRDLDPAAAQPLLDRGAAWGESPKAMAEAADLIITCLPNPAASATVMEAEDGILAGLSPGKNPGTDHPRVPQSASRCRSVGCHLNTPVAPAIPFASMI